MSHPLEQKIGTLRSRIRRLLAIYAMSWMVGAALATIMVLGLADYLIRFQDPGIRVIASLAVVAVSAWTCYRYLIFGLRARLRDVDLARRLQKRFPTLGDNLASAVEFLKQPEDDPIAGSFALRRAVISETTAESQPLEFSDVIQRGPTLRAAMVATSICLLAAILVVVDPVSSGIAVARLANPFGDVAWPQKTHLRLRKQLNRVARGQSFEIEVVAAEGTRLPPEVRIHYRFEGPDGATTDETERMRLLGGAMVARRENVVRPFSYRVQGGDDHSMPWIPVEVVEPPAVASISVELTPPDYTGWPTETAQKHLRALVGTRVRITAEATKPLRSAAVVLDSGRKNPGRLSDDGLRFTVPGDAASRFVIEKSGAYWFELTDREGLSGGDDVRWEIRAVPDRAPTLTIERPTATVFVTSGAVVPIRVAAKDDLAIAGMALLLDRLDGKKGEKQERSFPLYSGPKNVAPQPDGGLASGAELGESRVVDYRWELAGLKLQPGIQAAFHATATDYRGQTGKSQPRRLVVITPEELTDRIAGRQNFILAELARVLKMQRQSRTQVAELEIRLAELGHLDQLDLDHLRGAELNQRQVDRSLSSPTEGVPMHILGLLGDLENNKVDSPDIRRRMRALLVEIDRLKREHLPIINRELTAAIKTSQVRLEQQTRQGDKPPDGAAQRDTKITASLATAGKHQDQVIASLEEMLGRLARWDNYRRYHREIGRLLRDQEELMRRATELARKTLTRELKDLTPQELANLKVLARRQTELARRLDRTLQEMDQTSTQLQDSDPLAAETVADAIHRARELAVGSQMRSAGDHLEQNQMGQAISRQDQAVEDLQEVLDILAGRREHELVRLIKKLGQAQEDLEEIIRSQESLQNNIEQAAEDPDEAERRNRLERLGRQQNKMQQDTERMARRLERLLADRACQSTCAAADSMQKAGQCALDKAGTKAAELAKEAKRHLQEAQRLVAEKRRQARAELAMEQLARLEDAIESIQHQQKNVIDETGRLDTLQQDHGQLTAAQAVSLRDLARQQRLLQTETTGLGEKLVGAGAFQLALSGAARYMTTAAGLLERRQTGPPTQEAEKNALHRLDQLLEALKPEEPDPQSQTGSSGQGAQGGLPGGGVQTLAELKLLRILQQEINLRTRQLEETYGKNDPLPDNARREYAELSREQGSLADLMLELLVPGKEE